MGETSVLPDELISKLEKDVEATVKDLTPVVQASLEMLQDFLTNAASKAQTTMKNQQFTWTVLLGDLKAQAAQKKVNIDACLGQREVDLEQEYKVNFDNLLSCDNKLLTTGKTSINKFNQAVSIQ